MPKNIDINAAVTNTVQSASVTAAPTSTGIALPYSAASSSVTVVNTGTAQDSDVAVQLNSAGWIKLGRNEGTTLSADLSYDKLLLRRIGSNNGAVEVSIEGPVAIATPTPPMAPLSASLSILATPAYRPFCEVTPGVYLMTGLAPGNAARQLYTFTGDIVTGAGTNQAIFTFNWNDATSAQGLYNNAGDTIVSGSNSVIHQVWKLLSGHYLMMAIAQDGKRYLHRMETGTWNVGNVSGANNRRASLHIGALTGVSGLAVAGIHALHQRSLCEARVGVDKVILFAEYNVASALLGTTRVPGGLNDQVIVWKSTDDGLSFTKLLEFNTNGTHRFSHCHGVIQNPYTRTIYFMMGDEETENALITWDGVSAAPAANATFAQIAATPGWTISYGDELRRYGDLAFSPDGNVFGLPDSDTNPEVATKGQSAWVATRLDPLARWISGGKPIARYKHICPLIVLRHSNGCYVYGSLRTADNNAGGNNVPGPTFEPYHWFWTSVNGTDWDLAAKVKNYQNGATGNVLDLWEDSKGNVIAGVTFSRGVSWGGASKTASCAIFRVRAQLGLPNIAIDG